MCEAAGGAGMGLREGEAGGGENVFADYQHSFPWVCDGITPMTHGL